MCEHKAISNYFIFIQHFWRRPNLCDVIVNIFRTFWSARSPRKPQQCSLFTLYTVPDNYVSAKVTFLQPLKMQFRKNPYKPNDTQLSREYITPLVLCVSPDRKDIYLLKMNIPQENNISHTKNDFLTWNIKNLLRFFINPIGNIFPIGESNSCRNLMQSGSFPIANWYVLSEFEMVC